MIYIGIDPGLEGAIVMLDEHNHLTIHDYSNEQEAAKFLALNKMYAQRAVLEIPTAMPNQSSVSTLSQGINVGIMIGLLAAHGIPTIRCRAQDWQKEVLPHIPSRALKIKGESKKDTDKRRRENRKNLKQYVIKFARSLYPEYEFSDGSADALCMALYCKKKFGA